MAIPKVMGTETEYGIAAAGQPDFNPVLSSSMLISSYAGSLRKIRWDYEDESPMRDARGFEQVARERKAVAGQRAAVGVDVKRPGRHDRNAKAELAQAAGADALIDSLAQDEEALLLGRVSRSIVLRLAVLRGLETLEA